jgi:hypothetical protein
MRFGIVAFVLTAVVAASPFAAEAGVGVEAATTTLAASSTTANATRTHHGHRNPHKEPTPTFKTSCDCERPVIPAGVFNDKEVSRPSMNEDGLNCIALALRWIGRCMVGDVGQEMRANVRGVDVSVQALCGYGLLPEGAGRMPFAGVEGEFDV